MSRPALFLAAAAFCLSSAAQAVTRYTITDLGSFVPVDINEQGWTIGTPGTPTGARAFVRTSDGTMINLGDLPGGANTSTGAGINDAAQAVGSSGVAGGPFGTSHAFSWTQAGGMIDLGEPAGGEDRSAASAINNPGQIVGTGSTAAGERAFVWTQAEGFRILGTLPGGGTTTAQDINDLGQVVGSALTAGTRHAVLWRADGTIVDLGTLPGRDTEQTIANAINEKSQIVGQSNSDTGVRAFFWSQTSGMQALLDLSGGAGSSVAVDINDDGIAVGRSIEGLFDRAVIWTPDLVVHDLGNLTDTGGLWALNNALAINNKGQIVGIGRFNNEASAHGFLLTPYVAPDVPEPASWALMIVGFAAAGTAARWKSASLART